MENSNTPQIRLVKDPSDYASVTIMHSRDCAEYARNFFHDDLTMYESCFLILLNRANKTIGWAKISQGGISGTVVDPRIILKYALEALATTIILVHNHPSGNLQPSNADDILTEKVKNGCSFMDIKLMDHIILTEDAHYSYADEGKLF